MLCMGFNLELACFDCRERLYVRRGREAEAIRAFAKLHREHRRDVGIDNGFAERPWSYEPGWTDVELDAS